MAETTEPARVQRRRRGSPAERPRGPRPEAAAPPGGATSPAGPRILVVDDDRVDRMALQRVLAQTGLPVQVGEAEGVLAAIDLLGSQPFDCVLLDYNLPDGDGLTFLRGLRGAGLATPVVVITGQQDDEVARELAESGAADYIPKEALSPPRLLESLRRALGGA